jgi:hypothetical protein
MLNKNAVLLAIWTQTSNHHYLGFKKSQQVLSCTKLTCSQRGSGGRKREGRDAAAVAFNSKIM